MSQPRNETAEHRRLRESEARRADWKNWGPYLAERAWGTVREDYSADGDAWNSFPHDHARSRAYRWNEDGLAGWCNRFQNLCLGLALWNGKDPILKERLFGLSGHEGNHGEDVKEYYRYVDATPTHSYMKMLYKYPQAEYPYARLIEESGRRGRDDREFELFDALGDDFRAGRYFDVVVEFAKPHQEDVLCRITATNRGPEPAELHILPHLWYRNTWSWGYKPRHYALRALGDATVSAEHRHLGPRWWSLDGGPNLMFTENETNFERLYGGKNAGPYVKDAFHEAIIRGRHDLVNPDRVGSKAAAHYREIIEPGESMVVRWRFSDKEFASPFAEFDAVFAARIEEADAFHASVLGSDLSEDERAIHRLAIAGILWSKQFYHYSVELWLSGDPAEPKPPACRAEGRNARWEHVYANDVLSVPDKWEYPWFAAWDSAFHCITLALVDPEWAKRQLVVLLREWYMHPNGQLAAYEWNFNDANPPVHAHAARRVYELTRDASGAGDTDFLEEVFHKLLLNFTWWVNRKDAEGRNAFEGGFLGLDNIGVFDRSNPEGLPDGARYEQADGTAWMGMFCLDMLWIAIELSRSRPAYESMATKFFEHFVAISHAINGFPGEVGLWDSDDSFYYDVIRVPGADPHHLRVRSFVGLVPLLAVLAIDADVPERLPRFWSQVEWYIKYRQTLSGNVALLTEPGEGGRRLLTLVDRDKLGAVLDRMLDPARFLSDHGLRSLSKEHAEHPFQCFGKEVAYEPAESRSPIYGGNSNWRGPVWFPVNALMIQALREYHRYYGRGFLIDFPTGSGREASLEEVALDLARRLTGIFLRDEATGRRAVFGDNDFFQDTPGWRDLPPFHEYFHGDDGSGLGASHQTGWTALVAVLLRRIADRESTSGSADPAIDGRPKGPASAFPAGRLGVGP